LGEVTRILESVERGDARAADRLLEADYRELRRLAAASGSRRSRMHLALHLLRLVRALAADRARLAVFQRGLERPKLNNGGCRHHATVRTSVFFSENTIVGPAPTGTPSRRA